MFRIVVVVLCNSFFFSNRYSRRLSDVPRHFASQGILCRERRVSQLYLVIVRTSLWLCLGCPSGYLLRSIRGLAFQIETICEGPVRCSLLRTSALLDTQRLFGLAEYRCRSGQCIPIEFFRDSSSDYECADRTDEHWALSYVNSCPKDPAFQCEEDTCRHDLLDFPCGDGQCRREKISDCVNGRNYFSPKEFVDRSITSN